MKTTKREVKKKKKRREGREDKVRLLEKAGKLKKDGFFWLSSIIT